MVTTTTITTRVVVCGSSSDPMAVASTSRTRPRRPRR